MTYPIDPIADIEVYVVDLRQDIPYLGALRDGETVNQAGYFVRKGNQTVYPRNNRSLVVRLRTQDGVEGWGETYGLVAPKATAEIIDDLLAHFVRGRNPFDAESVHDELYGLMRVRGYTGGFYLDALAAIDIALWDIAGKITNRSVADLLGGKQRDTIPAYLSGLPEKTLPQRCELAAQWQQRGFDRLKFALPVADAGAAEELRALREALGNDVEIACDLHWAFFAEDAVKLAHTMASDRPWFLEAPVVTEDIQALAYVAEHSGQRIAVGEEWRTLFDARWRVEPAACHIVQPEMGHTGITQFLRISSYSARQGLRIIPHATIGAGIFLAASLQASATLPNLEAHEFQHSVMLPFQHFTGHVLTCVNGNYAIPSGPGIGVEPSPAMWQQMQRIK